MSKSDFLFSGSPDQDKQNLLEFIRGYAQKVGLESIEVDGTALDNVVSAMHSMPWPHGADKASPFKKIASFATNFAFYSPIITTFPKANFGELYDHQNSITAYELAKYALHGATIKCPFRGPIKLENPIITSKHFWKEFIATLEQTNPMHHFACISLLFESLVYRANPQACYTHLMKVARPELIK